MNDSKVVRWNKSKVYNSYMKQWFNDEKKNDEI